MKNSHMKDILSRAKLSAADGEAGSRYLQPTCMSEKGRDLLSVKDSYKPMTIKKRNIPIEKWTKCRTYQKKFK